MTEESLDNASCHGLNSLLSSEGRDFLVHNNGDQVKIKDLNEKNVGLYFSASWCPPCRSFTPTLIQVYNELSSKGDFEIIFISSDRDEETFNNYFSKMPWLAIPFPDSDTIKSVKGKFSVRGIPHLVFLDRDGTVLTEEGVEVIMEHQANAYPFNPQRINELKVAEEDARRNQTLKSLLISDCRDFLLSSNGLHQIPVSELEGKIVGLYFCVRSYRPCTEFTQKLQQIYNKLKEKGESFEIVSVYMDDNNEDGFKEGSVKTPWFALPFKDKQVEKLARYFELRTIPRLVIIGSDGKTLHPDVVEMIDEHGVAAYPFSSEKLTELAEIERAKLELQTLEDILVSEGKDYVFDKSGSKVQVSELAGKHVLIYFSAHWCPPCRGFTPKLIETYHEIKANEDAFEVIFVSSDRDQASFDAYYSGMPWLALPFGDERKTLLSHRFKVKSIPFIVTIGPEGKTVTTTTRSLIAAYGAAAFPFTEEHIANLKEQLNENSPTRN